MFVLFDLCIDDHGSFVIFRSDSVRPKHLFDQNFDHDYYCKLPCRERDAQSSGRRSTSRHVRYRAVPRTNRTLTTANTHNHSAHPVQPNRQPAPHRYLGNALVPTHGQVHVPTSPVGMDTRRRLGRLHQLEAQQGVDLLADMPQSLLPGTG